MLDGIKSIERLDDFDGEYVYDLEVEDTHTFFAGDVLVHNSIYVEFGRISSQLNIPKDQEARFVVDLWNKGCGPYMRKCYEEYAKSYNCDRNVQELELEKIADTALMLAKKHYAMSECFKEPNIYLEPGEDVLYKGLELIQGATPPLARKCQDEFTRAVLAWYVDHKTRPPFETLYSMIKKYKELVAVCPVDDISKGASVGDYEKFVADDKNAVSVRLHCPVHIQGSCFYNYLLQRPENAKYRLKYNTIKTRDKVKFYYTKDPKIPVFAFLPGEHPVEFAPTIDREQQFEKLILAPINRILEVLGYKPLNSTMAYNVSLGF